MNAGCAVSMLPSYLRKDNIDESLYCGACGYNLRTLPTVGRCPECGNGYNTENFPMRGVFLPEERLFPWGDVLTAAFCFCVTAGLFAQMVFQRRWTVAGVTLTLLFTLATLVSGSIAWRNASRCLLYRYVSRHDDD